MVILVIIYICLIAHSQMNAVSRLRQEVYQRATPTHYTRPTLRFIRFLTRRRTCQQKRCLATVETTAKFSVPTTTRHCTLSLKDCTGARYRLHWTTRNYFADDSDAVSSESGEPRSGRDGERALTTEAANTSDVATPQRPPPPLVSQTGTRQFVLLVGTIIFLGIALTVLTMVLVRNMGFKLSVIKVLRKFIKSDIARQVFAIIGSMIFVRSGLTPVIRVIREFLSIRTPWESSLEYYILQELYSPLEVLLVVAALGALAESLLPPLISVPRNVIGAIVRSIVSLTFVAVAARVIHNVKGRLLREAKWRMELEGKTTEQRRIDAVDKLLSVGVFIVASIMGLQSLGLDVNSVLAIGGVGGLAIGLAGREIFENLFSGLLIMGSRAFEVGDEVVFSTVDQNRVEGIVVDVGWYRTIIKDFQREVFVIPNSLFSRTVVLNVTRKGREWRFFEYIPIRVKDLDKAEAIISDMRRIIRQDTKVIQKLHKRAFLDSITREYVGIYISFYVEATNRDAFLSARQQYFFDFVNCVLRNGGELAEKKLIVEVSQEGTSAVDEQPSFLSGDRLQTMSMVDADADTIIPSADTDGSRSNSYSGEISSHVDVSSMIKNITPVDINDQFSSHSGKRKRDTPPR